MEEHLHKIDSIYKSEEGDRLAIEELLPVVERYSSAASPKILEIGCGYGRNLYGLSFVKNSDVVGCDISQSQLDKANAKMASYGIKNVRTVLQTDEKKLPFEDNTFDVVVLWQVMEHILSKEGKKALLQEAARVVRDGGSILVETPNLLFPFDYHDNNLPLVHWVFPNSWRYKITKKLRKADFPPSEYMTLLGIKRILKKSSHVKSIEQQTRIYFEQSYLDIFRHLGGTRITFKIIFFSLYFPIYLVLRLLCIPGDLLTPSLRVVFRVNK